IAYPFGVAGPILLLYLAFVILKPKISPASTAGIQVLEISPKRAEFLGKSVGELSALLPSQVQVVALRRDGRNTPASPAAVVGANDVLLLVGPTPAALDEARQVLGEAAPGRLVTDRRDLDYLHVFASRPAVVGRSLGDLELPGDHPS